MHGSSVRRLIGLIKRLVWIVVIVLVVVVARRDEPRRRRSPCAASRRPRHAAIAGLEHAGPRDPRRDRDRLDRGRDAPRPVPRPGLRPRPGADVADGGLAPHLGRPAVGAVRVEHARPRIASSGRSAGGRRPSATSPRCRRRRGPSSTPTPPASTTGSTDHARLAVAAVRRDRAQGRASAASAATTLEPWTALDTLAWQKVQAWQLGGNFDSEIFRMLADAKLGDPARTDELFPAYDPAMPVITPSGLEGSGGAGATAAAARGRRPSTARRPPADRARRRAVRGDAGRLARRRRGRQPASSRSPGSTAPTGSPATTRSARTTGSSGRRRPRRRRPSSPTTRISGSGCRRSGT